MLDASGRKSLTDLMQKNFTDLDIERDEPFKFRSGKYLLVVETVPLVEHNQFLIDMFNLLMTHKQIFFNIDFLTAQNLKDESAVRKLIDQVMVFQANKQYGEFINAATKFVTRWGYVCKVKGDAVSKPKHSRRLAKKVISSMTADVFIHVLFLIFVRNYDIVKKNLLGFLQMFTPGGMNTQTATSSQDSKRKVPVMPKYSPSPYPKSVLEIFAEQSKMH